jgi:mRNA interferase MazF
MVKRGYIPDAGDVLWVEFSSQVGHEQAGRRPAIVLSLSPSSYNEKASLALLCPITSYAKGYPFEVVLPAGSRLRGVILADQLKSLDWQQRKAQKAGKIPPEVLNQVRKRIGMLIGIS